METQKFEIKIDPLDLHPGLKDQMAEFESLIRMQMPGKSLTEKIKKDLNSRFCHCCFFGHVDGEIMGEPLCKECAKILYGFDADEEHPTIRKTGPYTQLWWRKRKALPIFEAYLHAEIERYRFESENTELKAEIKRKEGVQHRWFKRCMQARAENASLKRALWLTRAMRAHREQGWSGYVEYVHLHENSFYKFDGDAIFRRDNRNNDSFREWNRRWVSVERKCLAKAEEYK